MLYPTVLLGALSTSIVVGVTAAILSWREIPRPGARWLSLLLFGQVWWSMSTFFRVRSSVIEVKEFWLQIGWIGVVIIPLAWILFAFEYSGRDWYVKSRTIGALSIIPLLTIVIVATTPFHDLLTVTPVGYGPSGILRVEFAGVWYWVIASYTYLLGAAGLLLLTDLIASQAFMFQKQGVALFVGLVFPWATNVLTVTGILDLGIDPTPLAFAPSGVVYLLAIRRFRLLRANPAPTRRARQMVFDEVQEGAIIVDTDDNVIDLNKQAEQILDISRCDAIGSFASTIIPTYDTLSKADSFEDYLSIETGQGERHFEVEIRSITATSDRPIGRLVTINEVTDLLRQQQRLEVLHRVLRHNIRTETNLILGHAENVEGEAADSIQAAARTIGTLGEKGREAIDLFSRARSETELRNLHQMLEWTITKIEANHPEVTIQYEYDGPPVAVDALLDVVFRNVVENAAAHNEGPDRQVWIEAAADEQRATIRIADDGPGIREHEVSVLSQRTETSLEHGSGIGLWIIKWGTDLVDGDVEFAEREPGGTAVTIEVPVIPDEK
ncbi:histidine kinase N-terminal 7TM domain-containing protein [Halanaeroarchaeum sulfurireducens]|uniref:histidine kinase n=1 Tax=Halanaeroarchaeum sulfurireducens TaxID=1604004 RepID=A0A0F7P9A4_9EURY|nr:histidine kinase N-terminal 7TM domain-containing protein [Halanaeroarchaeum sulfurireducens]AKH97337.1 PAS domain S-box [Halanaeroarchaeum sulfurireducens]ALG81739.1 PAS domain S-box [Halanaeroarchaeum sulfurireducens]